MNKRQKLFVAEYLKSRNAAEAAELAGYSPNRAKQTGYELLRKPEITAAIEKQDAERRRKLGVEADELVAMAVEIIEKAAGKQPIRTSEIDGKTVLEYRFAPAAALKGVEMLMKHLGIQGTEKHEITHSGEVVYTLTLDSVLPSASGDDAGEPLPELVAE